MARVCPILPHPAMRKAVLFDLDDTLFDHRGCAREALSAVHQSHTGFRALPFETLEEAHARFLEELHADVMLGRVPIETARVERFRRLLAAVGDDPVERVASGIAAIYRETYRSVRRATAGAERLLAEVAGRARIAVVSNNLLEEQQDKLRTCGLDRFVNALVVSEAAGVSKPDPAIFRMALERLDVTADNAVMVGDSWQADVLGARAAGIRAIWFNPLAAPTPQGEAAAVELRSLEPATVVTGMILDANRD
jgi:HAD superfamily hydrolase (TIGR01549 family)